MTDSLTLVVCGAPLAERAPDVAAALAGNGWTVTVVGTAASRSWLNLDAVQSATGRPVVFDQRHPSQDRGPRPGAVVACPLTMNSGSKAASAIMDSYATSVLCEALAAGLPLTIVPMVSDRLWQHPAWAGHLKTLAGAGAQFVNLITGLAGKPEPVMSGSGPELVAGFDPDALARVVGLPFPS